MSTNLNIKKISYFNEKEIQQNQKIPLIFQNIFSVFPELASINPYLYAESIKNVLVNLTEIDITTLQRKKFNIKAQEGIHTIKINKNPVKRHSISYLNTKHFSKNFIKKIPIPQLIRDANYYSLNIWYGQKGYITPIHFDSADGLLFQITGKKKGRLIPPSQTKCIYRHNYLTGGPINFSMVSSLSETFLDLKTYPLVKNTTPIEFTLNPGEALYIPAGWWHELSYLEESISTNYWYGINRNKGPSWLMLNILACSYPTGEKNIYPFTYNAVLEKFIAALQEGHVEVAQLLLGVYIESILAEKAGETGSFLGNKELENLDISTKELRLLSKINDYISHEISVEELL